MRSGVAGMREATRAPRKPPSRLAGAADGDDVPVHVPEDAEDHQAHGGGDQRQRRLEGVGELEAVQGQAEDGDQDDAERPAEVPAVHGGQEEGDVEPGGVAVGLVVLGPPQPRGQQRRDGDQQAGQQHQHRHDDVEGRGRRRQQQDAARRPPEDGHQAEADDPPALAGVLAAEAGDPAEVTRPLDHRVGDVRRHGAETEGDQRGEEDQ